MSNKQGLLFILSAPAGAGKTTLVKKLEEEFPNIVRSISYTTRKMRPGEVKDKDYFFISLEEFNEKKARGEFLEDAQVFDHYYGTSREKVNELLDQGKHVFLVIDTQGAMKLKDCVDAIYIFVSPPSVASLRGRLMGRKSDSKEEIEKRLSWAKNEMDFASLYDYQIVNDDLEVAYEELRKIVLLEEKKKH